MASTYKSNKSKRYVRVLCVDNDSERYDGQYWSENIDSIVVTKSTGKRLALIVGRMEIKSSMCIRKASEKEYSHYQSGGQSSLTRQKKEKATKR